MAGRPSPDIAMKVFYSYAHEDEKLRDALAKQLAILRRQGRISEFHDRKIIAGKKWDREISEHLEAADIILLLISPDFLDSDYINGKELNRALERDAAGDARVVPVILRPCLWKQGDFAELGVLPTDGEPVTSEKWHTVDQAMFVVAEGILRVVEELSAAGRVDRDMGHKSIWNVPHRRNPDFTGRTQVLTDLHEALQSNEAAALTQRAIWGLGGIGKTQIALEYAYRHRGDYAVVWWVRAEDSVTLASDYAGLAAPLGLPEKDAAEQKAIVAAVRGWLDNNDGWLLIFDNARDRESVLDYVPQGGSVIITSRAPVWTGLAKPLPIEVMEADEAADFLVERTGDPDREAAGEFAAELGYLPLGLAQAASYVEETGNSLAGYLALFRDRQAELLQVGTPSPDYPATVVTTWDLAFEQLGQDSADLLSLCAFFAPDDIPLDVIVDGTEHLPDALANSMADGVARDAAIAGLRRFSLIGRKADELTVHRLVQAVQRDRLTPAGRAAWAAAAAKIVNAGFPQESDDFRTWPVCARLLPHALHAANWAEADAVAPEATGRLLNQAGLYLWKRADLTEAKGSFERALKIDETAYGPDHPTVAIRLNNLGLVLQDMGDLAGAKAQYERALKIDEATYGSDHPNVAIGVNNLGGVLRAMDDPAGAKAHYERALNIFETAYGSDHPNVATSVNNLGAVLQAIGDLAGAKAQFERALKIDEAAYGPDHPEVATDINNLGSVLRAMGDLAGAKVQFERALDIFRATLGEDHPHTATVRENLERLIKKLE